MLEIASQLILSVVCNLQPTKLENILILHRFED